MYGVLIALLLAVLFNSIVSCVIADLLEEIKDLLKGKGSINEKPCKN